MKDEGSGILLVFFFVSVLFSFGIMKRCWTWRLRVMLVIYLLVVASEVRNVCWPPAAPWCSFMKSCAAECLHTKLFGD